MAPKRGTGSKGKPATPSKGGKSRNSGQPTQKTEMQRVLVIGPTGKRRLEWRPWTN